MAPGEQRGRAALDAAPTTENKSKALDARSGRGLAAGIVRPISCAQRWFVYFEQFVSYR